MQDKCKEPFLRFYPRNLWVISLVNLASLSQKMIIQMGGIMEHSKKFFLSCCGGANAKNYEVLAIILLSCKSLSSPADDGSKKAFLYSFPRCHSTKGKLLMKINHKRQVFLLSCASPTLRTLNKLYRPLL